MRLIDADPIYERLRDDENLARDRVIDTPNSFPNGAVNPSAIRYMAQLNERTRFKEMVFDAPTIDAAPIIRCKECKWYGEPGCAIRIVDDTDKPSDMDFCSFAERKEGE